MTVGIITRQITMIEPKDPGCTEHLFKGIFNRRLYHGLVAIGCQQTSPGGEEGPHTVRLHRATLQNKVETILIGDRRMKNPFFKKLTGDLVVPVGSELESPAIETKIGDHRAGALKERDRPMISRPGII